MAEFNDLIQTINSAITQFNKKIPTVQKGVLEAVLEEVKELDLNTDDSIKNTVQNIRLINKIRQQLLKVVLTDDYKDAVKQYLQVFNRVTTIQNKIFTKAEISFTVPPVANEIKKQAVTDVVASLTEEGLGVNIGDGIAQIIKTNVVSGGSYASLKEQLRNYLVSTQENAGALERYVGLITTDAINQFTASYMNTVSGDLGYEWFSYQGKDIVTTRPFCDAMTDQPFFHISEVPRLLAGNGLYYKNRKTGEYEKVPIYSRTGLPQGMYPNEDETNFFVLRGGYNCGHQVFPVHESRVPIDVKERVKETGAFNQWRGTPIYDVQEMKQLIRSAIREYGEQATTENLYRKNHERNSDAKWLAGRNAVREKIINNYTNSMVSQENPKAFLMGGAPANGKSAYLASGKANIPEDAVTINPDDIKWKIPEGMYLLDKRNATASAFVHEESSDLAKTITRKVLNAKSNIVIDKTYTNLKSVQQISAQLRAAGYESEISYVTLPTELSVKLGIRRGQITGREVNETAVRQANAELARNFPAILEGNYFDKLTLWDTGLRGQPRLILKQVNGKVTIYNQTLYDEFLAKALR